MKIFRCMLIMPPPTQHHYPYLWINEINKCKSRSSFLQKISRGKPERGCSLYFSLYKLVHHLLSVASAQACPSSTKCIPIIKKPVLKKIEIFYFNTFSNKKYFKKQQLSQYQTGSKKEPEHSSHIKRQMLYR